MFASLQQDFAIRYRYRVLFTTDIFAPANTLLADTILEGARPGVPVRVLFVVDQGVAEAHPGLFARMERYCAAHKGLDPRLEPVVVPGGEASKNDDVHLRRIYEAIERGGICRHSYVIGIGGGAVLDMLGFAASTAHRGVRLIRVPTTVLAQNDSAVGVKNSVNAFGKKNFLGAFAPPHAVINDELFLTTLCDRDWRSGIAEAVKVALIKDRGFFEFLERSAPALAARDMSAMGPLIHRCAQMHVEHIAGAGDPFESGSSRPLDFGHWAAHKLENLTHFALRHGEAVAIGIALDTTYSYLSGSLAEADWLRILALLEAVGFDLWVPELSERIEDAAHPDSVLQGLAEFREHLGGELTIMLLSGIGSSFEVHAMDAERIAQSAAILRARGGKQNGGNKNGNAEQRLSPEQTAVG